MNTMTATAAATKIKGPIVWLDMDQQALDDAYDQNVYAPNRDQVAKRRVANSAAARARLARSVIRAGKSAFPSIAFSGAVMSVSGPVKA